MVMSSRRTLPRSLPDDIRRYEQQAGWRDFATPIGLLGIQPGWRILDVGCGSGVATRLLARRSQPGVVVGLDAVASHAAAAYRLAAAEAPNQIAFVAGDARRLPFPDRTFDLLWASFVVEYVASEAVATLT